jgi:hypothetical protein
LVDIAKFPFSRFPALQIKSDENKINKESNILESIAIFISKSGIVHMNIETPKFRQMCLDIWKYGKFN